MNCYCISGLGADKRVFEHLDFGYELQHIEWIPPLTNESIKNYTQRLTTQIDTSKPFILLGLSFGGVIACEMNRFISPKKTIHISSIVDKKHLPKTFKVIGALGIHKWIPAQWFYPPLFLAFWFFGIKEKSNKKLLKKIFDDSDRVFTKWAITKLLSKEPIPSIKNLIRIHGTNDRLLPLRNNSNVHQIENGGHFMVLENSNQVNHILKTIF